MHYLFQANLSQHGPLKVLAARTELQTGSMQKGGALGCPDVGVPVIVLQLGYFTQQCLASNFWKL